MNSDFWKVFTLVTSIVALLVTACAMSWQFGRRAGYEAARVPCEVTCGVTFRGDHWEVRRGTKP